MSKKILSIWECLCDKCGHIWITRTNEIPKTCAKCKTEKWDKLSESETADPLPIAAPTAKPESREVTPIFKPEKKSKGKRIVEPSEPLMKAFKDLGINPIEEIKPISTPRKRRPEIIWDGPVKSTADNIDESEDYRQE